MNLRVALLAIFLTTASAHGQPATSEYTSTASKDCRVLEKSKPGEEGGDYFREECRGFGGYTVLHVGGDARSWVEVKFKGTVSELYSATMELAPGFFGNKANKVVEWRGLRRAGGFEPYALIYRLSGTDESGTKSRTRLIVIKLDKAQSRVVGFAEGKDEDARAKQLADAQRPKD